MKCSKIVLMGFGAFVVASLVASPVVAEVMTMEPVVVSASKIEMPLSEVGSSVTVISREEIERKQATHVLDLLRTVPAVDVVRLGGVGQQTSVFLRGANSDHTLMLIDGMEVNDPSTPSRSFDFASLSTDNIERIEIMRGPGSTLYGSDAIGGVINIITRKGSGEPQVDLFVEGGEFKTHQERASVTGSTDLVHYSVSASNFESDGISAAGEKYGNQEDDGYKRQEVSGRIGVMPVENFDLDFSFRYNDSETDLDNAGGIGGDDPNNVYYSESIHARMQGRLFLFDGMWEQKLSLTMTDYDRSNQNKVDPAHPFDTTQTQYDGQLFKTNWQHNLYLNSANTLTLGAEYQKEEAKGSDYRTYLDWWTFLPASSANVFEKQSAETASYYIQDQVRLGENFTATLGARLDDHDRFGSKSTYRVAANYLIPQTGTRLKGTYGTAFKAPTLNQLYDNSSWYSGNLDLNPEESKGWDVGFEQSLFEERLVVGVTYFENKFEELIDAIFNPAIAPFGKYEYVNIDEAESKGVEVTLSVVPMDDLSLSASYTYTDTEDSETGEQLLRRPRTKMGVNANYQFLERGNLNVDLIYIGERDDYAYPENVTLKSYSLTNVAASWQITDMLAVTGRVENLFDKQYEEVLGFGTPGVAGYAGVKLQF